MSQPGIIARFVAPLVVGLGLVAPASAQGDKIYDHVLKSTVWIVVPKPEKASGRGVPFASGTGTLVDAKKRIVLTNHHVVGDAKEIYCVFPIYGNDNKLVPERKPYLDLVNAGQAIRCTVVETERRADLALIQLESVPAGAKVMPLARDGVSPGQQVHSVGNPGASGALWIYTPGKVRQVYQKKFQSTGDDVVLNLDAKVIETDSPTNPGDSGGPLVTDAGELVGVTQSLTTSARALSTFIELSEVKSLLKRANVQPTLGTGKLAAHAAAKPAAEKPAASKEEDPAEALEKRAAQKLRHARLFAEEGRYADARDYCEEILSKMPKTKAAVDAKSFLETIKDKK